jgi:hypothetical protein
MLFQKLLHCRNVSQLNKAAFSEKRSRAGCAIATSVKQNIEIGPGCEK